MDSKQPIRNKQGNAVLTVLLQNAAYNDSGRGFRSCLESMAQGADTCLDVQVLGDLHNSPSDAYDRDQPVTAEELAAVKEAELFAQLLLEAFDALIDPVLEAEAELPSWKP